MFKKLFNLQKISQNNQKIATISKKQNYISINLKQDTEKQGQLQYQCANYFCLRKNISNIKYEEQFNQNKSYSQQKSKGQNLVTRKDDIFTVSLIGRPNVGKSSLFNKLSMGDYAITDATPGLTRDRKETITNILGFPIRIIDTAGMEREEIQQNDKHKNRNKFKRKQELIIGDKELRDKMYNQTHQALIYSDLAIMIVDAKEGLTSQDYNIAQFLKKSIVQQKKKQKKLQKIAEQKLAIEGQNQHNNNQDVDIQENNQYNEENNTQNQEIELFKNNKGFYNNEVMLVANKCDIQEVQDQIINEAYQLGFGQPIFISCEQGDGLMDLLQLIKEKVPQSYEAAYEEKKLRRLEKHLKMRKSMKQEIEQLINDGKIPDEFDIKEWEFEFDQNNLDVEENSDLDSDSEINIQENLKLGINDDEFYYNSQYQRKPIQLTVVGRQNAGKSTLANALLKDDRVIVDDLEGTTRDSIKMQWVYQGRKIDLVDTAGVDKKMKTRSEQSDLAVAQYIAEEGRALIVLVNKWDLVPAEYKKKAIRYMEKQLESKLSQVTGAPFICVSAKTGYNLEQVMQSVLLVHQKWDTRITTGILNDWLNRFKKTQNAPVTEGQILKIRFISQIRSRPPTFSIFVNDEDLFKTNYLKYFRKSLVQEFKLEGVPIRFLIRDSRYRKKMQKIKQKADPFDTINEAYKNKKDKIKQKKQDNFIKNNLNSSQENQDELEII
ncbi:P-loop containing nucleoside triphosphate hydrolase [Pseudocohnilembus persalinus]|uniref:GTPase Der n=1 Tax=Pseudocohnilembus persalinus TaxID=266149 RepID=A0A0V0R9H8_PSEPJ|nr:P-loop containing nucleoside triphosphate hydrolase [Pseudocohnilembus persalinus]|eukprot:KRX11106.1 P-loop containing nucleoside triphosphate hydrolase [Pseudocohnilembus persalinus]